MLFTVCLQPSPAASAQHKDEAKLGQGEQGRGIQRDQKFLLRGKGKGRRQKKNPQTSRKEKLP